VFAHVIRFLPVRECRGNVLGCKTTFHTQAGLVFFAGKWLFKGGCMAAFVFINVKAIHDQERYEHYKLLTPPTIEQYGGKFVARGGLVAVVEGAWSPGRVVMIEFPNIAQANAWIKSAEYAPAKALRREIAETDIILVDGT
jgi:uncharacterized protein (DUF1330 family)